MELKYLLVIMALLYLLPELFRRKPKKYEYPDVPEKVLAPASVETTYIQPEGRKPVMPDPIVMPATVDVPATVEEPSPWQGQLQPQMIQNGYIFAEILQPPRAYRPLCRSFRRR